MTQVAYKDVAQDNIENTGFDWDVELRRLEERFKSELDMLESDSSGKLTFAKQ